MILNASILHKFSIILKKKSRYTYPYRKLQLLQVQLYELAFVSVILFKTHFFPQNYPLPLSGCQVVELKK